LTGWLACQIFYGTPNNPNMHTAHNKQEGFPSRQFDELDKRNGDTGACPISCVNPLIFLVFSCPVPSISCTVCLISVTLSLRS
jgi:hypothetical protein